MKKKFYIDKFYFLSARYKLVNISNAELYLNLNYATNSFTLEKVNGNASKNFVNKAEKFAKELLKKKSRVNSTSILKEKYSKIFQS